MQFRKRMIVLAAIAGCLMSGMASARMWTFRIGGDATGDGVMNTDDALSPDQTYRIDAISGTFDGASITRLMPLSSFGNNNNLMYANGPGLLDGAGLTFLAGGVQTNVYYDGTDYQFTQDGRGYGSISLAVAPASAVPEPACWAMMIVGIGFVGGAMRRERYRLA